MESSQARDQTYVPCISRHILIHCTLGKSQNLHFKQDAQVIHPQLKILRNMALIDRVVGLRSEQLDLHASCIPVQLLTSCITLENLLIKSELQHLHLKN